MCDVIKIRLKRRIAAISGKVNYPLNIKNSCRAAILKARITKLGGALILFLDVFL